MSHISRAGFSLEFENELPVLRLSAELIRAGNVNGAVNELKKAIKLSPDDWRLHDALGDVLVAAGREEEAIGAYFAVVQRKPELAMACVKIGSAFFSRGMSSPALFWLRRAMSIDENCENGMISLAMAEAKAGCRESVTELLKRWLAGDPDNPIRQHLVTAVLGETTPARPIDGYVTTLFDDYAPVYDESMARLQYRGPQMVADALKNLSVECQGDWVVVDAGCGTGIVGDCVRPYASYLIGVDLSENMLQQAKNRGIYDALYCDDMLSFLRRCDDKAHLIVAADSLTYLGDLGEFFAICADRLVDGGLLIFTLEALSESSAAAGYRLNPSGRFSHHQACVLRWLDAGGLTVRLTANEPMRHDLSRPVPTLLFAAEKAGGT